MTSKARITSDFPTPRDVASRLRIPANRVAELKRQLFELHITRPDGSSSSVALKKTAAASKSEPRNGKKTSAARVSGVAAKKK